MWSLLITYGMVFGLVFIIWQSLQNDALPRRSESPNMVLYAQPFVQTPNRYIFFLVYANETMYSMWFNPPLIVQLASILQALI